MNIYRCPSCSREFKSDAEGLVICPSCSARVRVQRPPLDGAPWDQLAGGWLMSYVETLKLSFSQPIYFFESVSRIHGMGRPLLFALINAFVVALLVAAYQVGFQTFIAGADLAVSLESLASPLAALSVPLAGLVGMLVVIFFVPLATCAGLFIGAGLYHICLMVLGAAHRPFVDTFRVACYATGPQLLQILPLAGGLIATIWQLVLTIVGLKMVHRTTYGKATLAVFLPLILCCSLIILFIAVIAGGVVGAIMSTAS